MKLLIDEMYPRVIAERLRQGGHDAAAVTEQGDLAGLDDVSVCDLAVATRRAIVTETAADFLRIVKERMATGSAVPTLLITSNRSFPRHPRSFVGRAVRALSSFCDAHPEEDRQAGAVYWLQPIDRGGVA